MDNFDLIVIGGGPAGYLAAERAGQAGLRAAVVEKRSLGGVCLNEGCIPSKALLNSAKLYDHALHGAAYGVTVTGAGLDHAAVIARKNRVVKKLVGGVKATMKHCGVTVLEGVGRIAGRGPEGFQVEVDGQVYTAAKLLLAAGSEPVVPPIPGVREGLESGFVLTNREILDLEELPGRLVVVGGGVIGLEMASYFCSAGCKVTVLEMLDKIAGPTDREISGILEREYAAKGVDFRLGCRVTAVGGGAVEYSCGDQTGRVEADKVLLSIGRRACTQGLGLESIGVHTQRGAVVTDHRMRTNVSGVYAAGDINGRSMLAHTAYREAEVAVNNLLGKPDVMRYSAIPSVIYTSPEVACVGETEQSAREKGMDVRCATLPMSYAGRYVAEVENGPGICKVVVDNHHNRLVGVHLIGSYASEMIYGAGLMIESELRLEDLRELVFPHPTVSEIIREALFSL